MTHPIKAAVIAVLQKHAGSPHHEDTADEVLAEVLRLAREPSVTMSLKLGVNDIGAHGIDWYRAGIDALLREVKEG